MDGRHDTGRLRALGRHLEGWELLLLSVGIAAAAVLLALPHAAVPTELPLPRVDRAEQRRIAEREMERAAKAERRPLPFEVRAVGEAFRSYGSSAAEDSPYAVDDLAYFRKLISLARRQHGDHRLLELIALQTKLFVKAVERWEATGNVDSELTELGGDFLDKAKKSGWLRGAHALCLTELERRTLFRIRWCELAGLREVAPFAPERDEYRVYYRFLLEHPDVPNGTKLQGERRLQIIHALEKVDPEYESLLALGVVYYGLGQYVTAAQAFEGHLAKHPDGAFRLRAQNHLAAALAQVAH